MLTGKTSRNAAFVAAALLLGAGGAHATPLSYTSYSFMGDNINITNPLAVTGGAGQITLQTNFGSILAWCVDIYHDLALSGTYNVGVPGPPAVPPDNNPALDTVGAVGIAQIGGLMLYGNTTIGNNQNTPKGTAAAGPGTYTYEDIAAAVQTAIWSVEYGHPPFAPFLYTVGPTDASAASFSALVSWLLTPGNVGLDPVWTTLFSDTNQELGTLTPGNLLGSPGPTAGAGLPGLALAGIALFALYRRRQNTVASVG